MRFVGFRPIAKQTCWRLKVWFRKSISHRKQRQLVYVFQHVPLDSANFPRAHNYRNIHIVDVHVIISVKLSVGKNKQGKLIVLFSFVYITSEPLLPVLYSMSMFRKNFTESGLKYVGISDWKSRLTIVRTKIQSIPQIREPILFLYQMVGVKTKHYQPACTTNDRWMRWSIHCKRVTAIQRSKKNAEGYARNIFPP